MIKEILSNSFNMNINKKEDVVSPPSYVTKEVISNSFNININKVEIEVDPKPPQNEDKELQQLLDNYSVALKNLREKMQKANDKIATNVFDLKTHEDIFNKLTNNGQKKAIIMQDDEIYINATYVKAGLLEGCMIRTSEGGKGQHIHMEEGAYTAYDGTNPKAYLGFRNPIDSNKKSNIAFLAMGHDGIGGTSPYIALQDYPAKYNPIGLSMAYSELAYQFYNGKYSSLRWLGNGSMETNVQDYLSIGTYQSGDREELLHIKKKNGKGCIGTGRLETEYIETVGTITDTVDSKKALVMTSNNKETGVVLYSTNGTKSFEPIDGEAGKIYCGSSWKPWKGVYSNSMYSTNGVVVSEVSTAALENEVTLDNAIDNISFVEPRELARTYNLEEQTTNEYEDIEIVMDVTNLKDTNFVNIDENNNVSMNDSELLKLALSEIKKLKEKVRELENKSEF